MNIDTKQLQSQLTSITKEILSKHAIIATISVLLFLIYVVYTINSLIDQASDETYRAEQQAQMTQTNFDAATIEKINKLDNRTSGVPSLPSGRINPFVE